MNLYILILSNLTKTKNYSSTKLLIFDLLYLMEYQIFMGYLMPKLDHICKCLVAIITIFSVIHYILFHLHLFTCNHLFSYSCMVSNISI